MVLAIWQAIRHAVGRDLGTFGSIRVNHFFLFVALLVAGNVTVGLLPQSAYPFLLLLGVLMLLPLSSDPLARVPPARFELWPLTARARFLLRLASLALSPTLWLVVLLLLFRRFGLAAALLALLVAAQMLVAWTDRLAARHPRWNPFAFVPAFPGRTGQLVRNHIRQMLCVLDSYLAVLLSAGGAAYRVCAAHPDPAAFPILALLVGLALSTAAQCLFGLDSDAALTRYRLLPLRGRQILLTKDLALLAILLLLVLPLSVLPGLTFGLTALAVGHFASVARRLPQFRWRFLGGRMISGVPQILLAFAAGFEASRQGPWFAACAAALWALSLWIAGRRWESLRAR